MKKLSFIVLLLSATVFAHAAKVGFLVIGATDEVSALPDESYNDSGNEVKLCPERAAYSWFKDTYSATSKERILISTLQADGSKVPDDIDVLWVNLDRNGDNLNWTADNPKCYDVIFNTNVCTALENFIKRGGNLLLTKQAARIVTMIHRISEFPICEIGSYTKANDSGSVQEIGSSTYKVFNRLLFTDSKTQLLSSEYKIINGIGNLRESVWKKTSEEAATFETDNTCKILGRDGDTINKVGFVEFYPSGVYKGTVLVMGLHAYQWSADMTNKNISAVKLLTQNMLDYLCAEPNITWNATTGVIGSTVELSATAEAGFDVAITSQDETKATYSDGNATWQYFGSATLRATATPQNAQKGIQVPKNATTKTADHTVTISGGDPATYGYVLTYSLHTLDAENLKPDYTAAKWFYDNYVSQGTGCFINPTDYSSTVAIPSAIKVLWVHSDKWGLASADYYTALGGDNFRDALKNYIIAGGNAFLSKQATRLIGDIGRAQYYPCYEFAGSEYSGGASDTWYMTDDFKWVGTGVSRHWHRAFRFMTGYSTDANVSHWPLVSAESSYNRTDHWYLWGKSRNGSHVETDTWGDYDCVGDCAFNQKGRLTNFESKQKCTILGGWGHTANLDAVGMAEFYPATVSETDFKGSVITMGLGAYQWTTDNTCANMAKLTKGVLEYLTDVPFVIHHNGDSEGDPREVNNYKETYAGGTIGTTIEYRMKVRDLNQWYSLSLPFTVSAVKVWDGGDNAYYDLVPYYRSGGTFYLGHYVIRTPETATDLAISDFDKWNDPESPTDYRPSKNTPYIIQWHDTYFKDKYVSFFGASGQTIPTSMNEGSDPSSDNVLNVYGNDAMISASVTGCYTLEPDYGGNGAWLRNDDSSARTVLPFECFIRAKETTRARYRVLRRGMTDTTTGIDPVSYDPSANANKVLINGQIVILRDNKMYNVMGMEVQQ